MIDNTEKTEGAERSSAKIYQFPLRGRMAGRDFGRADTPASRYLAAASGDSWYHQAAIDEDKH